MPRINVFVSNEMFRFVKGSNFNKSRIFQRGVAMQNIKELIDGYSDNELILSGELFTLLEEQLSKHQKETIKKHVVHVSEVRIDPTGVRLLKDWLL